MSAQPVSGASYSLVSGGAGTVAVSTKPGILHRIIIPGTYVGTLNLHDAGGATGTTSSSQIVGLGLPSLNFPKTIEVGVGFRNGLTYQATGTPVVTLVWD